MLTIKNFKTLLQHTNHPDWLLVGVGSQDDKQLYILSNGGIANINCEPIEAFPEEIKTYTLEMISQSELYLKKDDKQIRIGHDKSIYSYSLKSVDNLSQTNSTDLFFKFIHSVAKNP